MSRQQPPTSPDNYSAQLVPVFTADPHGAAMFHGILNGTLGHLGGRVSMDTRGKAWHGWTAPPQGRMTGAANLGTGRPAVNPVTRFDQSQGIAADSIQAAFAQRSAEGKF